jgi:hypothetical protein
MSKSSSRIGGGEVGWAGPSLDLAPAAEVTPAEGIEEEHHTVAEISTRWKCSEQTVRRRIRAGELRSKCTAAKHLVPDSAVKASEQASSARTLARMEEPVHKAAKQISS